jgi:hypothetical protein
MKIIAILAVATALCATNIYANCDANKTLFFCNTVKGKQIEVCDAGDTINYSFGKKQKTEMSIKVPRDKASTYQWDGMSSSISYAIDIPNGDTTYTVFFNADRISDEHAIQAGVNVLVNKNLVTTVNCTDDNKLINNLEGVNLKPTE